ncbi:MAG TPA: hypothetical protein VEW67_06085 [Thermoleophilaceae bacterium]|nr:hypothetical protein [Thermoleophilaceae bacterium]
MVLAGNHEAFEVLFERHVADSLWYAREVLGSWGEAEEAVRHSFAAAHAYLETRGHETEFVPWLHTILGNHCLSMLQARAPGPARHADGANVVDLGEWRLRRKLFGVALPIAPSAALRDSVMAACGIGAGAGAATTAGVPLLGGALAHLAVVAVLAGGMGVAGHVATDRVAAVDAGAGAQVERRAYVKTESRRVHGDRRDRGSRREYEQRRSGDSRRVAPRKIKGPGHDIRKGEGDPRRESAPVEQPPSEALPATPVQAPAGPAPPALLPATVDAPPAIPPVVDSTLRRVVDIVKATLPATGGVTEVRLPDAVDLSRIGDDLDVTATEPPVDDGALPPQGADAPPN